MSQKDYIALAAAFKREKPSEQDILMRRGEYLQWKRDVLAVSRVLAGDNIKFKMDTFLRACDYPRVEQEGGRMTHDLAIGCMKHKQPVQLNGRFYYIYAICGDTAKLRPYGYWLMRGYNCTTVKLDQLESTVTPIKEKETP